MGDAMERCRLRWVVDVDAEVACGCFEQWLALLPTHEQEHVRSFVLPVDQHRALISRLLARCCVCIALGVAWQDVAIALTKGRKPFTTNAKPPYAPNFNFNVSHEGRYVALASDPLYLVGVDVAAPRRYRPGGGGGAAGAGAGPVMGARSLEQYLQAFRGQLADSEWAMLQRLAPDDDLQETAFQRLWSLKEVRIGKPRARARFLKTLRGWKQALDLLGSLNQRTRHGARHWPPAVAFIKDAAFIKARGDGLGFQPLSRAAFEFPGGDPWATSAQLVLDGNLQSSWSFSVEQLPCGHCVSVALGPAAAVVDEVGAFRATLKDQLAFPRGFTLPLAEFFMPKTLNDLLHEAQYAHTL